MIVRMVKRPPGNRSLGTEIRMRRKMLSPPHCDCKDRMSLRRSFSGYRAHVIRSLSSTAASWEGVCMRSGETSHRWTYFYSIITLFFFFYNWVIYGILSNSLCVTSEKSRVILVPEGCVWPGLFSSLNSLEGGPSFAPSLLSFHSEACFRGGLLHLVLGTQWVLRSCNGNNFRKFSLFHWWFPLLHFLRSIFMEILWFGCQVIWIFFNFIFLSYITSLWGFALLSEFIIFWNFYWHFYICWIFPKALTLFAELLFS